MPCDAETLLEEAAANGFCGLDDRSVMLALIASMLPNAGNPTAEELLESGCAYYGYDDRQLDEAIAAHLCEVTGG
jgi:hypothetical protein